MDDKRVRSKFRFSKAEIKLLADLLGLYLLPIQRRCRPHPITALCVVLYRLTFPTRLTDMELFFGRSSTWLSLVFNNVVTFLIERF
ncbi:uncharacterized protein K441DRAFT_670928 [Cenococcum geophilum 1.58]|uniref:uncharacterized protein n=1 Tax=Cenococcum geophilum 1.58 TaxID=794803 RepID=UPI000DC89EE8|nr:hypothetical protein K441DRAFT_670928 [Cenococcum geophilum 1.58]